jgi:hypothetical protein
MKSDDQIVVTKPQVDVTVRNGETSIPNRAEDDVSRCIGSINQHWPFLVNSCQGSHTNFR